MGSSKLPGNSRSLWRGVVTQGTVQKTRPIFAHSDFRLVSVVCGSNLLYFVINNRARKL